MSKPTPRCLYWKWLCPLYENRIWLCKSLKVGYFVYIKGRQFWLVKSLVIWTDRFFMICFKTCWVKQIERHSKRDKLPKGTWRLMTDSCAGGLLPLVCECELAVEQYCTSSHTLPLPQMQVLQLMMVVLQIIPSSIWNRTLNIRYSSV